MDKDEGWTEEKDQKKEMAEAKKEMAEAQTEMAEAQKEMAEAKKEMQYYHQPIWTASFAEPTVPESVNWVWLQRSNEQHCVEWWRNKELSLIPALKWVLFGFFLTCKDFGRMLFASFDYIWYLLSSLNVTLT